jgi:hypothetical protein
MPNLDGRRQLLRKTRTALAYILVSKYDSIGTSDNLDARPQCAAKGRSPGAFDVTLLRCDGWDSFSNIRLRHCVQI